MKKMIIIFASFLTLLSAKPVIAEEGRYQAIRLTATETETSVFILDTKEGHLWIWGLAGFPPDIRVGLIYQGKIRPGKKAGENVYSYDMGKVKKK